MVGIGSVQGVSERNGHRFPLPGATRAREPAPAPNLLQAARATGRLGVLLRAVGRGGLEPTLARVGPLTLFAPTDDAFARLPAGSVEALLGEQVKLAQVLTYHVVPGRITTSEVLRMRAAPTLNGEDLPVFRNGGVSVDGARVVRGDIPAANGVIHLIDRVLLPAMM